MVKKNVAWIDPPGLSHPIAGWHVYDRQQLRLWTGAPDQAAALRPEVGEFLGSVLEDASLSNCHTPGLLGQPTRGRRPIALGKTGRN
jgi:hypothetical protein